MRSAFFDTLLELAAHDERIWLVTGDLGFSVIEKFAQRFPNQFLNAGVAEQNMTGIAAGLALSGKIVFTYSIANFPVMRCLEQIRNDVCYHGLNVKIVAVGGGLAYAGMGYSHHAVEDLAVTRVLPQMTVLAPGDPWEARWATRMAAAHPGPVYLRLGKAGEPAVHRQALDITLGKAVCVRDGAGLALFSTGGILPVAVQVAQDLNASLWSVPTITPFDAATVLNAARQTGCVASIEEHGEGGLSSLMSETLAGVPCRYKALRLPREPLPIAGTQDQLRAAYGLDAPGILAILRKWLV